MDYHQQFATKAMEVFEEFYLAEYLPKTGLVDSPLARATFYSMMIGITETEQDYPSKDAVLKELKKLYGEASEAVGRMYRDLMQ